MVQHSSVGKRKVYRQDRRWRWNKNVSPPAPCHASWNKHCLARHLAASGRSKHGATMLCRSEWFFELLMLTLLYEHHGGLAKIDLQATLDFWTTIVDWRRSCSCGSAPSSLLPSLTGSTLHLTQKPSPPFLFCSATSFRTRIFVCFQHVATKKFFV